MNRRQMLLSLGAYWVARPADLPLHTPGLEHIGMTVPDQEATAKFYGRIFDPQLFQEHDRPRFYCRIGTSYIAFGGDAIAPPRIDHFCALVQDYNPQEIRKSLDAAGISMGKGPGGGDIIDDLDGLRLQLFGAPGGLARTIIPASRISLEEPALHPIGFDHIVLAVSDLEKSVAHYRKVFGMEVSRTRKPERTWFAVAKTQLGLETVASAKVPAVDHVCVKIAGFDKRTATERLRKLGVEIAPSNDEDLLRFRDPYGIVMELKAGV
jgi:catechol 2,3-dioxygenase-like lactoylglutathione lyase family enzyme